jgi:hypothetical protein
LWAVRLDDAAIGCRTFSLAEPPSGSGRNNRD